MSSRKAKVLALSAGNALAKVITVGVTMVMARVLAKEDLAAYQQTFLAYATIAPLVGLGIGQGMYYFLPVEKTRIRGRVFDGMAATGLMGLLFAAFIAFGGNELLAQRFSNPKVAHMLLWMIPYSIITTPTGIVSSVLVARERINLSAVFGVVQQLLIGLSTVIPLLLWQTAEASLIGNVVASILMAVVAINLMLRSTPADAKSPSVAGVKQLTKFTVPLALGGMFGAISLQLDKLIVGFLCAPEEFAVYALGAMEIPLIGMVTGAITSVMLVDMRKAMNAGNPREALRLFHVVAEKSSIVILPVMLFLMLTAETVVQYLYGSGYADSAIPFRIYLLMLPIRTVVFGSLIVAIGRSDFILTRSFLGLLMNVVLSTSIVLATGAWGAAIATVTVVYLWAVPSSVFVIGRELKTRWYNVFPFKELGKVGLLLTPALLAAVAIKMIVENIHLEFFLIGLCFGCQIAVQLKLIPALIQPAASRLA